VVVSSVSDATLRETAPQQNFGADDSIEIDTASIRQHGLIKPDNLGDIAPGAQVVSAELVFEIFNPGDQVEIREVIGSWSESAVTWASAPALAPGVFATISGGVTGEVSIDITGLAQAWVDGAAVHGLALLPTGSDGVDIYSGEYPTASLRPTFVFDVIDGGGECPDGDSDGHLAGFCGGDDCDDDDAATHPGAGEQCDDGLDNDCDGATDCADGDCDGDAACSGGSVITVVLEDLDDAFVSDGSPGAGFGGAASLEVDTWADRKRSFIKPGGLGGIPPGSDVVSAQLVLEIHDAGDVVLLAEPLSDWSEGSITYSNAPSSGAAFESIPAQISGAVAIDVTELVQRWVDGDPIRGVALEPTSSNGVQIRSAEYSDPPSRPRLVIEVVAP
jgi:hypothetical protein